MAIRRKTRDRTGEVVCNCGAYDFPHRMLGGMCSGAAWVADIFLKQLYRECRDCHYRTEDDEGGVTCQVIEGLEPPIQCPELRDFIRYEGIKLYGDLAKFNKRKIR